MAPNPADLTNRFTYHPPSPEQIPVYQEIRNTGHEFARLISVYATDSRELSLALTAIEEAVMWANAAIARNGLRDHRVRWGATLAVERPGHVVTLPDGSTVPLDDYVGFVVAGEDGTITPLHTWTPPEGRS